MEDGVVVQMHRSLQQADHLTITAESGLHAGKYLTHEVLYTGTGAGHAAKLYSVLEEYNSVDTLQAVICDNTLVNTGHKTGAVTVLEKLLDRKIHKLGCQLHWNELPLREIFKQLDGGNSSGTIWTGPIGQRLSEEDLHLQPVVKFKKVETTLAEQSPEVVADLSADQKLLLNYVLGIHDGEIPASIVNLRPGPPCLARWLTMATRVLYIYTRTLNPSSELQRIVAFICKVYVLGWFSFKGQSSFLPAPIILHELLGFVKELKDPVCLKVFKDKLKDWAFPLLSENFLVSMLFCEEEKVRKLAVFRILELRQLPEPPIGSMRIQPVNFDAKYWWQLICLASAESEPPITKSWSDEQVKAMEKNPCNFPRFPIHTQSVERAVKNTSEAAPVSWSKEKRHKSIVTKSAARAKRPKSDSKQDFC